VEAIRKLVRGNIRQYGMIIALVFIIVLFQIITGPTFKFVDGILLQPMNVTNLIMQTGFIHIMAIGMMLVIVTGGIDLSVVGVATMSSMTSAILLLRLIPAGASSTVQAMGILIVLVVLFVVGILAGLINGLLITRAHLPAMLATIGTSQMFIGIATIISGAQAVSRMPEVFVNAMTRTFFGVVPFSTVLFIIITIIMWAVMTKTTLGTKILMVGSNEKAARFSGLNNDSVIIKTYIISAVLASVAGLIMLGNYNSAKAGYGESYTLQCLLIAVLGGISPLGGKGSIGGVALSVITIQILSTMLNMFAFINSFIKPMIWGAVLILVLYMKWSSDRKASKQARLSA